MIIDTSALVAILLSEKDAQIMASAIDLDVCPAMSAVSFFEASMVIQSRRRDEGVRDLDAFVQEAAIDIVPFTKGQADIAGRAFKKYGKGRHPAKLNFGDCVSYALAKDTGEPLLFKGTDFGKTDIAVVELPASEN